MPLPRFISTALGLTAGLSAAQDVMRSPWSDSSHLEAVTFDLQYGINARGAVSREAAIGCATVSGVRDVIAGRIFRLPLIEYNSDGQPVEQQPSYLTQPERGRPRSQTILWTVDELIFNGRAFWQVMDRNATDGRPSWFRHVPAAQAEVNTEGQMIRAFGEDVTPRDSIRIDGPHEGLLVRGAGTIRRAIRLDRAAARAENNPVPSIDLHNEGPELDAKQIEQLIASWNKARETSGVGYSSKALKVNALGQVGEQLMIEGRRAITLELLRHMGAGSNPEIAAAAADGSTLNYTNKASREQALIDNVLALYMTSIEDRLSLDDISARGRQVKFNTDVLTREDTKTRYETYKIGREIGLLTDDDIKKAEGKR